VTARVGPPRAAFGRADIGTAARCGTARRYSRPTVRADSGTHGNARHGIRADARLRLQTPVRHGMAWPRRPAYLSITLADPFPETSKVSIGAAGLRADRPRRHRTAGAERAGAAVRHAARAGRCPPGVARTAARARAAPAHARAGRRHVDRPRP